MKEQPSALKTAIIGCGAITQLAYLPALSKLTDFEVVSLIDLDIDRARQLARDYDVRHHAKSISDLPPETEIAVVALPNDLHRRASCDLMEKKLHVFCEKPMATTRAEAEAMVRCSEENNVRLGIGNVFRFYWTSTRVKEIIQSKELGNLVSFHIEDGYVHNWPTTSGFFFDKNKSRGGVLLDMGAHLLDLLLWWIEDYPATIQYQDDNFGGVEAECCVELSFGESINGTVKLSRLSKLQNKYTFHFERGVLTFQPYDPSGICNAITIHQDGATKQLNAEQSLGFFDYFKQQMKSFAESIRYGTPSIAAPKSIVPSIRLIEECYSCASRLMLPWVNNGRPTAAKGLKASKSVDIQKSKILITGASGFIGSRTAARLFFDYGAVARCLVKDFNRLAKLSYFPTQIVRGNVLDYDSLRRAAVGCDVVIHCAYGNTPDDDLNTKINTLGTENIIKASLESGVKRFIHLSTVEVYGENQPKVIDEQTPPNRSRYSYGNSKLEAESISLRYHRERELPLVILRLALVYGPYAPISTVAVVNRLLNLGFCFSDKFNGICNPVYIDDCVDAIFAAVTTDEAIGEVFNVSGGETVTWNRYFDRHNQILGLPPITSANTVQLQGYWIVRRAFDLIYNRFQPKYGNDIFFNYNRLRERKRIPNLKSFLMKGSLLEALDVYSRQAYYSIEKARTKLSFEPRYNFDQGMALVKTWLRHTSQIPQVENQSRT